MCSADTVIHMEEENAQPCDALKFADDNPLGTETELDRGVEERGAVKKRTIKLTPKALMEKIDNLQMERKTKLNKLSNLRKTIVDLMNDKDYVNEVKCTFNKYNNLCDETKHVHVNLLGVLPKDEAAKHEIWYKAKMLNINDFIANVNKWLAETQSSPTNDEEDDDDGCGDNDKEEVHVEPHVSISNIHSNISGKQSSHKSSKSNKSYTSSALIKAEAEKAALMLPL